jgi:predicted kinase
MGGAPRTSRAHTESVDQPGRDHELTARAIDGPGAGDETPPTAMDAVVPAREPMTVPGDTAQRQPPTPVALELVILVGLPGSGKSSFYRARLAGTHRHVSKDLMPNVRDRNRRQRELVERALVVGESVVVDNTNVAVADRAPLIALGRQHGARVVAYYFDVPVAECRLRNRGEGRRPVPDVALYAMARRLETPTAEEGLAAVHVVRPAGASGFEVDPLTDPARIPPPRSPRGPAPGSSPHGTGDPDPPASAGDHRTRPGGCPPGGRDAR